MRKTSHRRALRCARARSPCSRWAAPSLPRSRAASAAAAARGPTGQAADSTYYSYLVRRPRPQAGNAGEDVKTLNWVLRGLALGTPLHGSFVSPTESAVRSFQSSVGVTATAWCATRRARSSPPGWSARRPPTTGPGFYGNTTACGQTLTKKMVGVAHKKLPCGSRVVFAYKGRWARAKVIDRGPYIGGRTWDLTGSLRSGSAPCRPAPRP